MSIMRKRKRHYLISCCVKNSFVAQRSEQREKKALNRGGEQGYGVIEMGVPKFTQVKKMEIRRRKRMTAGKGSLRRGSESCSRGTWRRRRENAGKRKRGKREAESRRKDHSYRGGKRIGPTILIQCRRLSPCQRKEREGMVWRGEKAEFKGGENRDTFKSREKGKTSRRYWGAYALLHRRREAERKNRADSREEPKWEFQRRKREKKSSGEKGGRRVYLISAP